MQIDAIILSHADMSHIGSLPLLYKQLALTCPVFATLPVQTLGQICLQDALSSIKNMREFSLFSMEDIDSVFDKITSLRYSQPYQMIGKCLGITLTSYAAGHTVGGSIWKIKKDTNDIVYAVDYNQKKELHLNGSVLHLGLPQLSRPSLLITDSFNALNSQQSRKERDASMIGNYFIPVFSSVLNTTCYI